MSAESTETLRHVDRTGWDHGPWDDEPDRVLWEHAGFPCLIHRNGSGAWCGYVAVPPGHRLHGQDYGADDLWSYDCHGGLTYSGRCSGHICHAAKPGEPDDVWWFGFDCHHSGDFAPGRPSCCREAIERYWTARAVTREVEKLAEQLRELGT